MLITARVQEVQQKPQGLGCVDLRDRKPAFDDAKQAPLPASPTLCHGNSG